MKDIQAASMAIPTSGSKGSNFKVTIDVKDLEKVEKILYIAGRRLLIHFRTGTSLRIPSWGKCWTWLNCWVELPRPRWTTWRRFRCSTCSPRLSGSWAIPGPLWRVSWPPSRGTSMALVSVKVSSDLKVVFLKRKFINLYRSSGQPENPVGKYHEEGDGSRLHAWGADRSVVVIKYTYRVTFTAFILGKKFLLKAGSFNWAPSEKYSLDRRDTAAVKQWPWNVEHKKIFSSFIHFKLLWLIQTLGSDGEIGRVGERGIPGMVWAMGGKGGHTRALVLSRSTAVFPR